MDDLISKQAFKEECLKAGFFPAQIAAVLKRVPAVDAVEVKYGRWEKASEMMPIYRCSVCKERNLFKNGDNVFSNYCPNCGAKMDGERKE